jgi:hypothetical protein
LRLAWQGGDFLNAWRQGDMATITARQFDAWSGLRRLKSKEPFLREPSLTGAKLHHLHPIANVSTLTQLDELDSARMKKTLALLPFR